MFSACSRAMDAMDRIHAQLFRSCPVRYLLLSNLVTTCFSSFPQLPSPPVELPFLPLQKHCPIPFSMSRFHCALFFPSLADVFSMHTTSRESFLLVAILCIPYIAENYRVMRDISCFLVDFAVENPVLQECIKLTPL